MAYVPDEIIKRKREISRSAWDVYEALCAFADSDTGVVESYHFSYAKLVEWAPVTLGTARNAMSELRKKGWARDGEGGRIHLIGVFVLEARRLAEERKAAAARTRKTSLYSDTPSLVNDTASPASDATSPASDTASLYSDADIDKERARGFTSPDQPSTSPKTNPHTPAQANGPPARDDAPPDGVGVCVSFAKSRYPKTDCIAWAEDRRAKGANIDPHAVGRARWLDGTEDDEIGEFLARRGEVQEGRRPVGREETPYHVAAQAVASVAQVPGNDVGAFIRQMDRVSEETREKLRRRFLRPPGGAVEARAHAPP